MEVTLTPGATTSFTISGNSLTATYTYAVAAVQDGINNTPYVEATIEQASLESWKDYFEAIDDTNTVNFSLDYDASSNAGNTNFASDVADDTANTAISNIRWNNRYRRRISNYQLIVTSIELKPSH